MDQLRHSQLPPLPRLLDHLPGHTLSSRRAHLHAPPGAPVRDSRSRGRHHDLLVCRLYRSRCRVARTSLLPLECMPGFAGCNGVWSL